MSAPDKSWESGQAFADAIGNGLDDLAAAERVSALMEGLSPERLIDMAVAVVGTDLCDDCADGGIVVSAKLTVVSLLLAHVYGDHKPSGSSESWANGVVVRMIANVIRAKGRVKP